MNINKISLYTMIVFLSSVMSLFGSLAYGAAESKSGDPTGKAPSIMVEELFDEMNARLQTDKEKIEADNSYLLALGDEVLGPYVAFDKMAKQVLGKHWKKITKDQQTRYTDAFKNRVSLAMVSQYDSSKKYALTVTGERQNKKGNRALVKSQVKELSSASSNGIDYKLYLNKKTGNWQVYDVIVEGISVLQSFKSASADEIKRNGIEKLIEQLIVVPTESADAVGNIESASADVVVTVKK